MVRPSFAFSLVLATLSIAPAALADPTSAKCIASLESASSSRKAGNYRDARSRLANCTVASCPAEIRAECGKQLEAVSAAIPSIIFEAKDRRGHDLTAVEVSLDGKLFASSLGSTATEFDPGPHTFTFTTAGEPPVTATVVLREGEKGRHERIQFGADATPAAVEAAASPPATATPTTPATPTSGTAASAPASLASTGAPATNRDHNPGLGGAKTAAIVLAGTGAVALGVGVVFGSAAFSSYASQTKACSAPSDCPSHSFAVSDHQSAVTSATLSTVLFASAGGLLGAAAALWFTAAPTSDSKPTVSFVPTIFPGAYGVAVSGGF